MRTMSSCCYSTLLEIPVFNQKHKHKSTPSLITTLGLHNSLLLLLFSGIRPTQTPPIHAYRQFHPRPYPIIRALTHYSLHSEALRHYNAMHHMNVHPDTHTFPSVINACAAALGDLDLGFIILVKDFGELGSARQEMTERDIVSWNSLVSGYTSNGYWEEAFEMFGRLRSEGLVLDCFSISSVLPACGGLVDVKEGRLVHGLVVKIGVGADVLVSNGILAMYFKFGWWRDAQSFFEGMVVRDCVSWNTVICGYSQLGLYDEAICLFREMIRNSRLIC